MDNLELLSKYRTKLANVRSYDVDDFRYQRVTELGCALANKISDRNHNWDRGFSDEPTPQHWSFKLMLFLRIKHTLVYAFLVEKLKFTEQDLFDSEGSKTMPILIRQQEELIDLVINKLVPPKDRMAFVVSEQLILHMLVLEAGKEYMESKVVLNTLRRKMGGHE